MMKRIAAPLRYIDRNCAFRLTNGTWVETSLRSQIHIQSHNVLGLLVGQLLPPASHAYGLFWTVAFIKKKNLLPQMLLLSLIGYWLRSLSVANRPPRRRGSRPKCDWHLNWPTNYLSRSPKVVWPFPGHWLSSTTDHRKNIKGAADFDFMAFIGVLRIYF